MAEEGGALCRVRFLRTTTTLMRSSKDATNITARKPHSNPTAGRDSVAVRLAHGHQAGVTPDHTQESQRIRCREASDVQERY